MSSLRFSRVPAIDTALKLVTVAVAMFAFVFVVMVPLYNVLCDALGINGKTSSQAYTAVPAAVDESREVTVQFVAINNDGMPWSFTPDTRMMRVNPGIDPHHACVGGKRPRHPIVVNRHKLHGDLAALIDCCGDSRIGLTGRLAVDA